MQKRIVDLSLEELAALAAEAGGRAVATARAAGLPVTGLRGDKIIKSWPDGREQELPRLSKSRKRAKVADTSAA